MNVFKDKMTNRKIPYNFTSHLNIATEFIFLFSLVSFSYFGVLNVTKYHALTLALEMQFC